MGSGGLRIEPPSRAKLPHWEYGLVATLPKGVRGYWDKSDLPVVVYGLFMEICSTLHDGETRKFDRLAVFMKQISSFTGPKPSL